ncbi:hypothetical protein THAOC_32936, partial [Thalassiosira oceanica]
DRSLLAPESPPSSSRPGPLCRCEPPPHTGRPWLSSTGVRGAAGPAGRPRAEGRASFRAALAAGWLPLAALHWLPDCLPLPHTAELEGSRRRRTTETVSVGYSTGEPPTRSREVCLERYGEPPTGRGAEGRALVSLGRLGRRHLDCSRARARDTGPGQSASARGRKGSTIPMVEAREGGARMRAVDGRRYSRGRGAADAGDTGGRASSRSPFSEVLRRSIDSVPRSLARKREGKTHRSVVKEESAMSLEYAGKRQRGDGDGFAATVDPAKTSATSSADLESMLKQALGRIDSLERQHEEIMMSMGRENRALRDESASTERQIEDLRDDIEALKSKNRALEWSLNRLASKVQEGWEYPVTIQPDEYWQNKGYDDVSISDLKLWFFGGLKKAVSQLEHGVCESVSISFVDHNEDLMPHWNSLFRSFDYINPYGEGVELCLHYMELDEVVMRKICLNIRYNNISRVRFSNNGFTNMQGAISELGNALKSQELKTLEWSESPIESAEDMTLFTRVLSQNSALDELSFFRNGNENAQALLSGVDFSTYKVLNFRGNNLETDGRTAISDLIAANSPLVELHLYQNRLNDDDAVLIAQSLGGNTHLRRLNVRRNNIQERGTRALYEAINNTSTLNAMSGSNHSCMVEGLSEDFDLEAINSVRGSNNIYTNRMYKIQKLIAERYHTGGGIVPYLNTEMGDEDSVLLAPLLMESVSRRHDAFRKRYDESFECSLGLLYELVKDWKMAELISFRSELI